MSDIHTLIVTAIPGADPDEVDEWREYAIECPGVTDACRAWEECRIPTCPGNTGDDDVLWDVNSICHGQKHQYIGWAWMTPTDRCYLVAADELPDVASWLADKKALRPGRYEIHHSFDDGALEGLYLVGGA